MSTTMHDDRQLAKNSELISALEQTLSRRIVNLKRCAYECSSSFWLEELSIKFRNGKTLIALFKDSGWSNLSPEARQAKPAFLYDGAREIEVYRSLLTKERHGTPASYGSIVDVAQKRFWLFTEKVDGCELYQTGDLAVWEEVARWLARFHSDFPCPGYSLPRDLEPHLIHYDQPYYQRWMDRALSFHGPRRELDRLAQRYDHVIDVLLSLPISLIHGEFYASNVLTSTSSQSVRISPVDWEMAAVGPGLIDVAALISGNWSTENRQRIARAYYKESSCHYRQRFDEFWQQCQYCCLHLAVQWLGWSADWSPPANHKQDWLREALMIADELQL